jgi:hypothetical protein
MPVECSTCHALFSRRDAMMRHKRLKHGESDEEDEDVDMDHSPAHSDADNNEEKDNVVFRQMAEKAQEYTADEWQKKYDKYKKQNMPEKKVNSKADEKTRGEIYQQFRKLYEHFLYDLYRLQEDATHNHVIEDIDEIQLEKYGLKKSIKMALNKNRHLLESYLDSSDEDDDDDDDDSEEEEEKDKPMPENRIPLFKRQPLEDKNIPVFKRTWQTPSKRG